MEDEDDVMCPGLSVVHCSGRLFPGQVPEADTGAEDEVPAIGSEQAHPVDGRKYGQPRRCACGWPIMGNFPHSELEYKLAGLSPDSGQCPHSMRKPYDGIRDT